MKYLIYPAVALFFVLVLSCEKEEKKEKLSNSDSINLEIKDLMNDVYYWYDKVREADYRDYYDHQAYMDAISYQPVDKWSYLETLEEYYAMQFGGSIGVDYGIAYGLEDIDGIENIRVMFLYPSTQAYQQGVRRGWIVNKVNNVKATANNLFNLLASGNTNKFEFFHDGDTTELTLTKEELHIAPVLHAEVITPDKSKLKVGYLVFSDFVQNAYESLDTTFESFKNQNITELIIDLRYNGGGALSVANYLASYLLDDVKDNDVFTKLVYNDKYASEANEDIPFYTPGDVVYRCGPDAEDWDDCEKLYFPDNRLNLSRVCFITREFTASASEMVINSLKPFLGINNVILFGSKTHGKPVGMSGFLSYDEVYLYWPVTFSYKNASNQGDFFNGIEVNYGAGDNFRHDFGDPEEASLSVALEYLTTGTVAPTKTSVLMNGKILGTTSGPKGLYYRIQ